MASKVRDIAQFSQEQLWELLTTFNDETKALEKRTELFFQQFAEEANSRQPVVSASLSKAECVSAAKEFRESFQRFPDRRDPEYQSLLKQFQHLFTVYDHVWRRDDVLLEEMPVAVQITRELYINGPHRAGIRALENSFFTNEGTQRVALLQAGLQKLVEGQDEVMKRWFWRQELRGFGGHVRVVGSIRPALDLRPGFECLKIPADIILLIFAATDIETCVKLREVSRDWYVAFHDSEGLFERKLRERNPWIKPGDPDLQTWADCVLVFVKRLQSGKWETTTAQDLSNIQVPVQPIVQRTVVGSELQLDEKLPSNFSGMFDKPEQLHVRSKLHGGDYHVDPWTRHCQKAFTPHTILREDEKGTVVSFEGVEITLHPAFHAQDIRNDMSMLLAGTSSLQLGRHHVQVMLNNNQAFVAPRDKPHFEHALIVECEDNATYPIIEVGDVLVYRQRQIHYDYHYLFDIAGNVSALVSNRVTPVAAYNGLVWFNVGDSLVPTFVDLKTPGKTHHRPDRAISGITEFSTFRQCSKSRGLGQFVLISELDSSKVVVDLASGVLTSLQSPPGWDKPTTFIPGFLDGVFQVRCMNNSVLKVISENVFREHGFEERERVLGEALEKAQVEIAKKRGY